MDHELCFCGSGKELSACCEPIIQGAASARTPEELMRARNEAIAEMQQRAEAMGAHAVVGVDIDYEVLGADNGMLMVTASGTAVQIARTA